MHSHISFWEKKSLSYVDQIVEFYPSKLKKDLMGWHIKYPLAIGNSIGQVSWYNE